MALLRRHARPQPQDRGAAPRHGEDGRDPRAGRRQGLVQLVGLPLGILAGGAHRRLDGADSLHSRLPVLLHTRGVWLDELPSTVLRACPRDGRGAHAAVCGGLLRRPHHCHGGGRVPPHRAAAASLPGPPGPQHQVEHQEDRVAAATGGVRRTPGVEGRLAAGPGQGDSDRGGGGADEPEGVAEVPGLVCLLPLDGGGHVTDGGAAARVDGEGPLLVMDGAVPEGV